MRGALNVAIFTPKEAAEVLIGRERASAQERQMYAEALQGSDAGTIELSARREALADQAPACGGLEGYRNSCPLHLG